MTTRNKSLSLQKRLKKIRLIASDVDGVLTDGRIRLVGEEELKVFNGKEAMKIEMVIRSGIPVVWVTGRKCAAVIRRGRELGVPIIFKKELQAKKLSLAEDFKKTYGVSKDEVLYVGDDWGDLFLMTRFGMSAAPQDASKENKKVADIITKKKGGEGVLAEVIEKVMRVQNTWNKYLKEYTEHFLE
jgi:3-deoxy-D-manno-octulosonate 8-phosphate phosphatase (KDO 8-P phosphatase)